MQTDISFVDHLFIVVLAIAYPVAGYFSFRRLLRRVAAGETIDRSRLYTATLAGHWLLLAIAVAIWIVTGRLWSAIGLGLDIDAAFLAGAFLTTVAIALLLAQLRHAAAADTAELGRLRGQLGKLEVIIPRNGNELYRFYALSLTAGVVEEVLWRGFMIWYLAQLMPLWAAAVVSAVGFGTAHAYQGVANLPRITLVGFAFAGLYLLTGSVWLPMILHVAVDMLQGRLGYEIVRRAGGGASPPHDAATFRT